MQETPTNINENVVSNVVPDPRFEEPFYVVDLGEIYRKIKLWRLQLPRVKPFYAVKCNPLPQILKTLSHLGVGFDCASKNEIDLVLRETLVDPSDIVYANPCKTRGYIRHAQQRGVKRMTFDNLAELDKIAEIYPDAELILRIKVDDSDSLMKFSSKFGASMDIVIDLLEHASALGLDVVGVSFHVGSGCCNPRCFSDAIANARWVFDQAAAFGFEMTLLDIGGGFPGSSGSEGFFDKCARAINQQLDISFPENSASDIEIIAEPGRFVAASALTLYTTVIARRREHENQFMYYLNDGVYGSFNCKIFDHNQPVPIAVGKSVNEASFMSILWGPTCDSLDQVHEGVALPEMAIGDWLAFRDMGAYTWAASSSFNGFTKPNFYFLFNASVKTIFSKTLMGRQLLHTLDENSGALQEILLKIENLTENWTE